MYNKFIFGERLDELLFEKSISLENFAKATDISLPMIYKYLKKAFIPSTRNAVTIAEFFNCSLDYLFGLNNDTSAQAFMPCKEFSANFGKILLKNDCTRYKLKKETNLPKQSVDDWYHGKRTPTIDSLILLAKYFDCSIDCLLGRVN